MATWRDAVWAAIQRQASHGASFSRQELITGQLEAIKADVGSVGATPAQTLSRVLQELRDDGVLIFDGGGQYHIAEGVVDEPLEKAIISEAWALQKTRIGQGPFRTALLARWEGKCPLTGIAEPALLRASHIIPWNRCESDAERVNPENGLLLSALWDAAFDGGLVSFADDGAAIPSRKLSRASFAWLCGGAPAVLRGLTVESRERLRWHRVEYGVG
jgi:hypothetical protein